MMDTTQLVDRYCAVWGEPDAQRRAAALERIWAPGATYTDPLAHAVGSSALLEHIARVRVRRPGARWVRSSAVDAHHGIARFLWKAVDPTGTTLAHGIDLAFLSADGATIERIVGFFGDPQPVSG
jgi:hypothetical protein